MFYASGVMFLVFFPSEPSNGDFPFLALSKLFLSSLRPSCVKKSNDDENFFLIKIHILVFRSYV